MVSDYVNDALAVTRAEVGIVSNRGPDIADDSTDIVPVENDTRCRTASSVGSEESQKIQKHLGWAAGCNVFGLLLMAGIFPRPGSSHFPPVSEVLRSASTATPGINAQFLRPVETRCDPHEGLHNSME